MSKWFISIAIKVHCITFCGMQLSQMEHINQSYDYKMYMYFKILYVIMKKGILEPHGSSFTSTNKRVNI